MKYLYIIIDVISFFFFGEFDVFMECMLNWVGFVVICIDEECIK